MQRAPRWAKEAPTPLRILLGTWALPVAIVCVFYGNVSVAMIAAAPDGEARILRVALMALLIHGIQNTMVVAAWQTFVRRAARLMPPIEDMLNIVLPPIAALLTAYVLPRIDPRLFLSFSVPPIMFFLLLILFQLFSLYIDNALDRWLTLLLWVFSFQSLELLSNIPLIQGGPRGAAIVVSLGTTGLLLFVIFLIGVVSSCWLLAKSSIRLSMLRDSWISMELRRGETSMKEVAMLDVNNLVHDLKNPIAVIKGTAQLITDGPALEKAQLILKAATYMETMVRELLTEEERSTISIAAFCDMIERHGRAFPWGNEIELSIADDAADALISVNRVRMLRAVFNVVENAWRSNERAGGRGIVLRAGREERMAKIEVLDSGMGLKGVKAVGSSGWGSTGLGLAFTRRVLSLHRGSFVIANRTDGRRGAKAALWIPIASHATEGQIDTEA